MPLFAIFSIFPAHLRRNLTLISKKENSPDNYQTKGASHRKEKPSLELPDLAAFIFFLIILLFSGILTISSGIQPRQIAVEQPSVTVPLPASPTPSKREPWLNATRTPLERQTYLSNEMAEVAPTVYLRDASEVGQKAKASPSPTPSAMLLNSPLEHTQYTFSVMLDHAWRQLSVMQTVIYVNHTNESLPYLLFVVEPNRWPDIFELVSLSWTNGQPLSDYQLQGTKLLLPLPTPLPPDASIGLTFTYRLSLPFQQGSFGYTTYQTNLADWYPFIPPYQEEVGWLVYGDTVLGEHLAYDIADYELDIQLIGQTQNKLTIAASAPLEAELGTNRYHYRHEAARNFAWSVNADYYNLQTSVDSVTIEGYIFPEHREAGFAVLEATAQAVALYSELFGAYPHDTLTFVEADFDDGLEFDGLYFLDRMYFEQYDGTPKGFLIPLAAHETVHQWWFGLVGNNQAMEPWLDEALAVYCELLFYERYHPTLVDWWWDYRIEQFEPEGLISGTIYDYQDYRDYVDAIYLRGAIFLHQLRRLMGNDAFLAFLRDYAEQNRHQQATSQDFFRILEKHNTADLSRLIEEYFVP